MPTDVPLAANAPYAAAAMLGWLRLHLVTGLEELDGATYRRVLPTGAVIALTFDGDRVTLATDFAGPRSLADVVARCRRILDADADPQVVDAALSADPQLAPMVAARPGLRVPGTPDGFELLVRAVLGQQVSVASAHTFARRLLAAYGRPLVAPVGTLVARFPTDEVLAEASYDGIGLTGARVRSLRAVAAAHAGGALTLAPGVDVADTRQRLLALPGVGPWTVEYVAMRALGDPDAFPASDLVLKRRTATMSPQRWTPWRSYAAMHLWVDHLIAIGAMA